MRHRGDSVRIRVRRKAYSPSVGRLRFPESEIGSTGVGRGVADNWPTGKIGVSGTPWGSREPGSATAPWTANPVAAAPSTWRESREPSVRPESGVCPKRRVASTRRKTMGRHCAGNEHPAKGAECTARRGRGKRRDSGMVTARGFLAAKPSDPAARRQVTGQSQAL